MEPALTMIQKINVNCDSEGIRTPNLLIRSQMLYPIELQNPITFIQKRVQIYAYFSELQILITFF